MSITKKILDLNENKMEDLLVQEPSVKGMIKAFGHGCVDGLVDLSVIVGGSNLILLVYGIIIKNKIKR